MPKLSGSCLLSGCHPGLPQMRSRDDSHGLSHSATIIISKNSSASHIPGLGGCSELLCKVNGYFLCVKLPINKAACDPLLLTNAIS